MTTQNRLIEFNYSQLETVYQGANAADTLGQLVERYQCQRVFILASRTLATKSDAIDQISARLGDRFAGQFNQIAAHTPRSDVLQAIDAARSAGTDLLVTVGGGSIIDAAKTVQFALNMGITSEDELIQYAQFADGSRGRKAGDPDLARAAAPVRQIAVPTTLSGAEYSNNAGVTDTSKSLKEGYRAPGLCPRGIIYDPGLGLQTPQWLWLSTAIRSLDHAVEGYCSKDAHGFLEGHFLHALRLFASSLPVTYQNPGDLQGRSLSQQAVWLACCGLGQVAHGASHGIGYMLGAVCGVPHGYTSCVMLPAVLQWNAALNAQRQQPIAEALGRPHLSAAQAVKDLVASLGLPGNLQAVGVDRDQLGRIAELACKHPVVLNNPRPIDNADQVMEILELAWD